MLLRKGLLGVIGIILAFSMLAFAQEPQPKPLGAPDATLRRERMEQRQERHRERMERHKGREGRGHGMGHFARELNLSDAQREQSRAIMQRRLESTKGQREELFKLREKRIAGTFSAEDGARAKALHEEIRTSMEGVRAEMDRILTAEQKAKREELKAERKAKHEQRIKERQERMLERRELRNKPQ